MGFYECPAILKLHAAILTEVQTGAMGWESDFSHLEQQMLMPYPLKKGNKSEKTKAGSDKRYDEDRILFCNLYQRGICSHTESPHSATFVRRPSTVHHICASCFLKNKSKRHHPDTSTKCSFYEP